LEATRCTQLDSARCPEPRLFGGRDGGLWEWPDSSCHSLVGSFKIEFFFFLTDTPGALADGESAITPLWAYKDWKKSCQEEVVLDLVQNLSPDTCSKSKCQHFWSNKARKCAHNRTHPLLPIVSLQTNYRWASICSCMTQRQTCWGPRASPISEGRLFQRWSPFLQERKSQQKAFIVVVGYVESLTKCVD
jgi:hypothetical protein